MTLSARMSITQKEAGSYQFARVSITLVFPRTLSRHLPLPYSTGGLAGRVVASFGKQAWDI